MRIWGCSPSAATTPSSRSWGSPGCGTRSEAGSDPATPAAIIERGYHPDQRVATTELRCLADVAARYGVTAPAVIVIGDVVTLSPYWADRVVEEARPANPAA